MLTVNIVGNGNQRTIEATEVVADSEVLKFTFDRARIFKPDGEIEDVTNGQVFVMNENGSTVARYDFRHPKDVVDAA